MPVNELLRQINDDLHDLVDGHSDLLQRDEFSQSDGVVLQRVVVNGDGEWDTDFVGSGVSLSDGLVSVVDLAGDQVLLELLA